MQNVTGIFNPSCLSDPGDLTMPALEYARQVPAECMGRYVHPAFVDASAYMQSLPIVRASKRVQGAGQ